MKITDGSFLGTGMIKQLIREMLLHETRITPENLPAGVSFVLRVSSMGGIINLEADIDGEPVGSFAAFKVRGEENPCLGAFEIRHSKSKIKGLGPLMYDIVMELATELGGGLISDRHSVSPAAYTVWEFYQDFRPDVQRMQLDSPENELTRTREDNCSVNVSKNLGGDDLAAWRDFPLSGAYRKPGMPTIRQLVSMKKLQVDGFEL
jgi:hypothetical protein